MRLFIAISASEINFDLNMALNKHRVNLNRLGSDYRWIPQENYHVTLNFLGELLEPKLELLKAMLFEIAHNHAFFHLKLYGLDAFPSKEEGRVLWIKVQDSLALQSLQEDCETRFPELGFDLKVRSFRPHLSVVNLRNHRDVKDLISPHERQSFGEIEVKTLTLYEVRPGGAFPYYRPLQSLSLRERC